MLLSQLFAKNPALNETMPRRRGHMLIKLERPASQIERLEERLLLSHDDFPNSGNWPGAVPIPIDTGSGDGAILGAIEHTPDTDLLRFVVAGSGQATIRLDTPTSNLDPYLYLYDANRRLIASNDDFNGLDSQVTISVIRDATYFVLADNYRDGSTGAYRLSIDGPAGPRDDFSNAGQWSSAAAIPITAATGNGSISGALDPRSDTDLFQFVAAGSGQAVIRIDTPSSSLDPYLYAYDDSFRLVASNDDFSGLDSQVTITVTAGRTYFILADNYADGSTGGFTVQVDGPSSVPSDDYANTGEWTRAGSIAIDAHTGDGRLSGGIEQPTDTDLVRFIATGTGQAVIRIDTPASALDPFVYVYDESPSHRLIASNDDFNGLDSQVTITVTAGQTYFVLIDNYRDGSTGSYTASVDGPAARPAVAFVNPTPPVGDPFGDQFGSAGAFVGNNVLIGAERDDTLATNAGSAYLFDGAGRLLRTIPNPTPAAEDRFGHSVAAWAGGFLVAAYLDDAGAQDAGAVHLFDASGNHLRTLLNPTPQNGDHFGRALLGVGGHIVVGAYYDDTAASDGGAAYVFDSATGQLLRTIVSPNPVREHLFGYSLAVVGDSVLIGEPGQDDGTHPGAAYLFDTSGNLRRTFANPTPAAGDMFGVTVAVSGQELIVGATWDDTAGANAGAVYIFDGATGSLRHTILNPTPTAPWFGESLAGSARIVVVGASQNDTAGEDSGAVFVFDTLTGTLRQQLLSPRPGIGDEFGISVAALDEHILIGSRWDDTAGTNAGAAYLLSL